MVPTVGAGVRVERRGGSEQPGDCFFNPHSQRHHLHLNRRADARPARRGPDDYALGGVPPPKVGGFALALLAALEPLLRTPDAAARAFGLQLRPAGLLGGGERADIIHLSAVHLRVDLANRLRVGGYGVEHLDHLRLVRGQRRRLGNSSTDAARGEDVACRFQSQRLWSKRRGTPQGARGAATARAADEERRGGRG